MQTEQASPTECHELMLTDAASPDTPGITRPSKGKTGTRQQHDKPLHGVSHADSKGVASGKVKAAQEKAARIYARLTSRNAPKASESAHASQHVERDQVARGQKAAAGKLQLPEDGIVTWKSERLLHKLNASDEARHVPPMHLVTFDCLCSRHIHHVCIISASACNTVTAP
jgi:hypothetical protein